MRAFPVYLLAASGLLLKAQGPPPDSPEFFESRVRPVLASGCYACHTQSALGDLRVDSRDALLKGGKSGAAIVPGDPDKSLLIEAVRQTNARLKMPMSGPKLDDATIANLAAWIKAGAKWPAASATTAKPAAGITSEQRAFWSFQPLAKPQPPAVRNPRWARTDIDRFVLARLERDGLAPVGAAERRVLIRRAAMDLTGLPPAPEEVEAFEKDKSPDAFAKVVDRLLASPAYGERWGRLWLDVARYGEDDYRSLDPMGRGHNPYPFAYLYRDWVIAAINDDMPYDMFVKAQIAGDLLDEKTRVRTVAGTGFLGGGPWYYDNGAVEITRADERHDRVDVVTRGFLGLTVACARCHDHKYDPIPTKDYYGLAGVFLNTTYHEYPTVPKSVWTARKSAENELERKQKLLGKIQSDESLQLAQTLAFHAAKYMQAAWKVCGEPKKEKDKVIDEDKLDYELFDRWLAFLAKPPRHYPYLQAWQKMIADGGSAEEAKKLAEEFQKLLVSVMLDKNEVREENEIISAKALPGTTPRKVHMKPNEFVTNDDFCPGCGLELKSLPAERTNLYTDVFLFDLDGPNPMVPGTKPKPALLSFRGWGLERQLSAERRAYMEALEKDIEALKKEMEPPPPYIHGVADVEKPVEIRQALRGNPTSLGDEVPRHFLTVLSTDPTRLEKGSGRLELAEAIVKQPLAARVIVNRVWKWHLGTGLVDTPSNFGITGERPTNPELLDYLASRFVDNGMSLKKLNREIMLSSVYQLAATDIAPNSEKDPANRLYWRANRKRMDAEQVRDSMLAVSGALDTKIGGPSKPLSPEYKRRTVYGKVSRYKLDDYLQLFDFPNPSITAEKRFSTTVPLQRLFFMNSDFVQQQAERLARKVAAAGEDPARVQKLYATLFGRPATSDELKAGLDYLRSEPERQYEEAKKDTGKKDKDKKPSDAKPDKLASAMMAGVMPGAEKGEKDPDDKDKEPPLPVTTWGRYVKALLSSSEFLYVD